MITYQLPLLKYYVVRLQFDYISAGFDITTFTWVNLYWDLLGNNTGFGGAGPYDLTNPVDLNQAQIDFAGIFTGNNPIVIGTCTITVAGPILSIYYTSNNPVSVPQAPSSIIIQDSAFLQIPIASNIQ